MNVLTITNESIGSNETVEVITYQISKGITLQTYDNVEAVLSINGADIAFKWDHTSKHAFKNINDIPAIDLLRIIAGGAL